MRNIIALLILFVSVSNAEAGPNQGAAIPFEQGEVIFSFNESSPNQVYIIGMSHRDTVTRANGSDTVKSQIEAYKVGEWLIKNKGLELLLPEGYFTEEGLADNKNRLIAPVGEIKKDSLDARVLEEKLENDAEVNAGILLMESYDLDRQQIESWNLYSDVRNKVDMLAKHRNGDFEYLYMKASLDYLQERRSAAMLQNIPEVIESEYGAGRIKNKKAILTIGISHLSGIIKHLKQQKIEILSPAFTPYDDYLSGVKLLEKDFGVTIIIPRTLADNRELLKLTRLDDIH